MAKLYSSSAILLVLMLSYSYNMIEARECKGCLHGEEAGMKNSVECDQSNCDVVNGCSISLVGTECQCKCPSNAEAPSPANASPPSPSDADAPTPTDASPPSPPTDAQAPTPSDSSVECGSINCDLVKGCSVSLVGNKCQCTCPNASAPSPSNATAPSPSDARAPSPSDASAPTPAKAPTPSNSSAECGNNCDLVNGCFVSLVGTECQCTCPDAKAPSPSNAKAPTPSDGKAPSPSDNARPPTPSDDSAPTPSDARAPTPSDARAPSENSSIECENSCDLVNGCSVSLIGKECQCICPNATKGICCVIEIDDAKKGFKSILV